MYGMAEVESIDREVRAALKDIEEQITRAESGQLPDRVELSFVVPQPVPLLFYQLIVFFFNTWCTIIQLYTFFIDETELLTARDLIVLIGDSFTYDQSFWTIDINMGFFVFGNDN